MNQVNYRDQDWWMKAANFVAEDTEFEIINFSGTHDLNYLKELIEGRAFQIVYSSLESVVRITRLNLPITFWPDLPTKPC